MERAEIFVDGGGAGRHWRKSGAGCCIIHHQYAAPLPDTAYSPRSKRAGQSKGTRKIRVRSPRLPEFWYYRPRYGRKRIDYLLFVAANVLVLGCRAVNFRRCVFAWLCESTGSCAATGHSSHCCGWAAVGGIHCAPSNQLCADADGTARAVGQR